MAKVNLSKAAKLVGKNRTTIWRHVSSGKLSCERDRDGLPTVDTSELIRVYGEIKLDATPSTYKKQHEATPSYAELVETINALRKEQSKMKEQLDSLSLRLTHTQNKNAENESHTKAENDPDWPKEVITMKDIHLRNELKAKYNS